jgi:hypothetical protein
MNVLVKEEKKKSIVRNSVCCWMCFNYLKSLKRGMVPKGALANNL